MLCLKGPTNIGSGNKFFSFCVIGEDTPDLKYKGEKSRLEIGKNNVFREFCKVHRGTEADLGYTKIGDRNLIMPGVMIAHDCVIGDENILVDNSALAGHVVLGDHVTLGGYTLIHQFCKLGLLLFYWSIFSYNNGRSCIYKSCRDTNKTSRIKYYWS